MTSRKTDKDDEIATAMTALSHPRRVAIFTALAKAPDGLSFEELLNITGFSVSTLTHHLRPMKTARLVASRRVRRRVSLRISGAAMLLAMDNVRSGIARASQPSRNGLRSV